MPVGVGDDDRREEPEREQQHVAGRPEPVLAHDRVERRSEEEAQGRRRSPPPSSTSLHRGSRSCPLPFRANAARNATPEPDAGNMPRSSIVLNIWINRFALLAGMIGIRANPSTLLQPSALSNDLCQAADTRALRVSLGDRLHRRALRHAVGGAVQLPGGAVRPRLRHPGRGGGAAWRAPARLAGHAACRDGRRPDARRLSRRRVLGHPPRPARRAVGAHRRPAAADHGGARRQPARRTHPAAPLGRAWLRVSPASSSCSRRSSARSTAA